MLFHLLESFFLRNWCHFALASNDRRWVCCLLFITSAALISVRRCQRARTEGERWALPEKEFVEEGGEHEREGPFGRGQSSRPGAPGRPCLLVILVILRAIATGPAQRHALSFGFRPLSERKSKKIDRIVHRKEGEREGFCFRVCVACCSLVALSHTESRCKATRERYSEESSMREKRRRALIAERREGFCLC